jgi:ComF family protein
MFDNLIHGLIDLLYPKVCVACRKSLKNISSVDNVVCCGCWEKIKRNLPPFCRSCGRHLENPSLYAGRGVVKHICPACIRSKLHFDRAFSACTYEGIIRNLIHEFKYGGKDYLGMALSKLMIEFIKEYNVPVGYVDYIVPVPLYKTRLREREFNQAQVLSRHIASEFNKATLDGCLIRHRSTRTQTELENSARMENVKGSFSLTNNEAIKGKSLLLIDDVLTTGATASEAAAVMKSAGANIVFVLTLAN